MPFLLDTVRNILMRLYVSVEKVVTMCLVYKIWWLLYSYFLVIYSIKIGKNSC